jgi:hypothetical protein
MTRRKTRTKQQRIEDAKDHVRAYAESIARLDKADPRLPLMLDKLRRAQRALADLEGPQQ